MTFWRMSKSGNFCNKIVSLLLIQTFILSSLALAAPGPSPVKSSSADAAIVNPDKIVIPREFGLVKSKFTGTSDRLVVHIQDAHCNYEAQSNIAKILENLIKNYNVTFVSVEGADGAIDTSWFKAFPDEEVRKEVADYFMKKGEITGPEFLSITTNYPLKLFGAETRSYYIENLNAFTSSYPLKADTERYYNNIKSALNRLKGYIYNDELKILDAKAADYESKKIQFNDYVRFLQELAEKHKINLRAYENFFRLVSVLVYEKKIDFNVTDKERNALIDNLSKGVSKDVLTELVSQSLSFKSGKISSAEYYSYLKNLAIKNGVDLAKDYPNLYNYTIYNSAYSRIENEQLFSDIKNLEIAIKEKLFQNDDQRTLEKLSRHIDILLGLVNIKLMNGDFDYYQAHKAEFSVEVFSDFIKNKTIQYGLAYEIDPPTDAVATSVPKLEDFYSIAIKRDKALIDNTLNAMDKEKQKVAVLITGGFHSEGISKQLEKEKISYMVVCPTITKDVQTPYIKILMNQRTPLEDILVGTAEAKEAKNDTLAPVLVTLGEEGVKRLFEGLRVDVLTDFPRLKVLKQNIIERITSVNKEWEVVSIENWLRRAIAGKPISPYLRDPKFMLEAYVIAMKTGLIKAKTAEKGEPLNDAELKNIETVISIIANNGFETAFNKIHERVVGGGIPLASAQISQAKAYSSPDSFQSYVAARIPDLIKAIPELEKLMQEYREMEPGDEKTAFGKKIDGLIKEKYNAPLVNEINGFKDNELSDDKVIRDIPTLQDFMKSPERGRYLRMARDITIWGRVCKIDIWAGAASRLFGEGQKVDPKLSYVAHDVYQAALTNGYSATGILAKFGKLGISMMTRLMVQEWMNIQYDLIDYYKDLGIEKGFYGIEEQRREIVWNTPRIIIINNESGESIIKEFVRHNFYGHNPRNVVFVAQSAYRGFDIQGGKPVLNLLLPATEMQLCR